ncbi:MAG TPA: Ig-like domain-containing protein, partial [Gemmatimonadaceae bacterium]|nr:Ig-like domain-containing protein [Gemmatimonadaceae bacterium]
MTFATPTHIQGNLTVSAGATGVTQTSGTPGTPSLITVRGNLTTTATTAPMTFTRLATKGTPALGSTTVVDTIIFAGTAAQGIPGGTYNTVFINGTPIVGANFSTTGNLTVFSTGTLTVGGKSIAVAGNLSTQASGSIAMAAGDTIIVGGNASFNGGASTLTGGLLQVAGNFSQGTTANSFAASSPHITRLTGATPQVTFANPTTSNFGTLQLATTGTVNFNTDVTTSSDIWLKTGFTPSVTNSGGTVNAGRAIFDTTGGRWHVANTVMTSGSGGTLPKSVITNLTFTNGVVLLDSLKVTGNVSVAGAGAQLDLNGHYVLVTGTFGTSASGLLRMVHSNDSLVVKGNATFNGGSTAGLLTFGYFEFDGTTFSQGTNAAAFAADAPHQTYFGGTTQQGVTFANPGYTTASHFGNLFLADTATVIGSNIFLNGQLQSGGSAASFRIGSPADHLVTSNGANLRNVVFDNVRWSTIGTNGAGLFPSIHDVTFQNISQTILPQFDYEYSTKTNITLTNFTFLTTPTGGGTYITIVGPDTLTMTGVTPSNNGGFLSMSGGGAVLSWMGPATQLVISQQPTNTTAGFPISPAIVVTAKDASNNVATSFVGSVSLAIGANPGGATLSGPPSVTAVAGVAVFNSMSLNKAGTGYTLVASSSGVTSATTSTFNITAGAAATLAITGGQSQSGNTLTPLATPLAVTVTDASGNPVSGVTVNWATSGGASMSPVSSVTNASGVATSSWT